LKVLRSGEPIRVGIVGLGYFGAHHARHYAANPAARLVAVADADLSRACAAAEAYGAEAYSDAHALIGKVDAVSVTAPTSLHHVIARDFLEAGVHVFVEKPIAADVAEAEDLVARARAAGVTLQVGHIERFSPAFRALQTEMGAPLFIDCVRHAPWKGRASDVDVVLDLMIHDIDLALTLAGAPVASVEASGHSRVTATNDTAEARLTFANGVAATLAASRVATRAERILSVTEADRLLVADLAAPSLEIRPKHASAPASTIALPPADNLAAEIAAFLACVVSGTAPLVGGQAGLDALIVADMILTAIGKSRASASRVPKRRA
jgi:predicted dehydrogenase